MNVTNTVTERRFPPAWWSVELTPNCRGTQTGRLMQTRRWPFRIGIAFPSCVWPLQVSDPLPIVDGHTRTR
jgi:hypothetical protein